MASNELLYARAAGTLAKRHRQEYLDVVKEFKIKLKDVPPYTIYTYARQEVRRRYPEEHRSIYLALVRRRDQLVSPASKKWYDLGKDKNVIVGHYSFDDGTQFFDLRDRLTNQAIVLDLDELHDLSEFYRREFDGR